jgi:membrane-bound lytic murein transglycosylase B
MSDSFWADIHKARWLCNGVGMKFIRAFPVAAVLAVAAAGPNPAVNAQTEVVQPVVQQVVVQQSSEDAGFQGYLQLLAARARSEGVSEATIQRMTAGLTVNRRVIELDRQQPGVSPSPPPTAPYIREHVDGARIASGRNMYSNVSGITPAIEGKYGVPVSILLSIWGNETNYGSYTGDFDLARSLATLAYEGRRRELFAAEFIALLKMADQGVPRYRMQGSWAGAFGNPQFLPTVYLRTAVDEDGDGMRDIWSSRRDTLASIANYFRDAGWRRGDPWGVRASVSATFNRSAVGTKLQPSSCNRVHLRHSAWKPVSEWRALGVEPRGSIKDETLAAFFEPDGPGTSPFLLTGNYRVILQYNCSNYYALSVGLLADEIAR